MTVGGGGSLLLTFVFFIDIEPVLVFSNQYYIRNLTTDGQYYGIITQGQHSVVTLDFDYVEQRLYFVDNSVQKIMRMFINGTGVETIVWHNILFADDLCVEWIGRFVGTD